MRELIHLIESEGHLYLLFLRHISELTVVDADTGNVHVHHKRETLSDGRVKLVTRIGRRSEERRFHMHMDGETAAAVPENEGPGRINGLVFSRLPLNIPAGVQAHLSALFWTSTDRRTLVLNDTRDQSQWAAENRDLLSLACSCLMTLAASRAAGKRAVPLELFPDTSKPSDAAEIVHKLFYAEVARRCRNPKAEQILYTVSGIPASSAAILLTTDVKGLPQNLKNLQAPIVSVNHAAFDGLTAADPELFQQLTPASLRAWLRQASDEVMHLCDPQILSFCISDGARKGPQGLLGEDLEGCPLALTADGCVHRFASSGGVLFVCCKDDEEWELAQHLPADVVLRHVPDACKVLLQFVQVRALDSQAIAEHGIRACGEDWARAFWHWYHLHCQRQPSLRLPLPGETEQEHPFDGLTVLCHAKENKKNSAMALYPLAERRRALQCQDLHAGFVPCLRACSILLVPAFCDCPPVQNPDALAAALRSSLSSSSFALAPGLEPPEPLEPLEPEGWRQLLEILMKSRTPEAVIAGKALPAFRHWNGNLGLPNKKLFPLTVSEKFRHAIVTLNALSETDGTIIEFLRHLDVETWNAADIAKEALEHSKDIQLVATIMEEGLHHVLVGVHAFPVQEEGGPLRAPEDCLLWDAEPDFPVLARRIDIAAAEQLKRVRSRLQDLGCRTQLDAADAEEIARNAERAGSHTIALNLLRRLESQQLQHLCTEAPRLRQIRWLPTSDRHLHTPSDNVWHSSAAHLVGRVRPIASGGASTLKLLGVKMPEDVDDVILFEQLASMVSSDSSERVKASEVEPLYKLLTRAPPEQPWVWTAHGCGFAISDHVCKDPIASDLWPFLHRLQVDWVDYPVFRGLQGKLEVPALLGVLSRVKLEQETAQADSSTWDSVWRFLGLEDEQQKKRQVKVACNAVGLLHDMVRGDKLSGFQVQHQRDVFLPAQDGILRPVEVLFVHDMPWSAPSQTEGFFQVHDNVPRQHAQDFGVKPSSVLMLQKLRSNPPAIEKEAWSQQADAERLRSFRQACAQSERSLASVIDLFLSMADIAGASVLQATFDMSVRRDVSLLAPELAHLQGPALHIVFDKPLHSSDWKSLRRLDNKWAQLFAFTDVVTVVSRGHVCFLDPLKGYVRDLADHPGGYWLSLASKDLHKKWPDQFEAFQLGLDNVFSGATNATVLRLPLRGLIAPSVKEKHEFTEFQHKEAAWTQSCSDQKGSSLKPTWDWD